MRRGSVTRRGRLARAAGWAVSGLLVVLAAAAPVVTRERFAWPSWVLVAVATGLAVAVGLAKRPFELMSSRLGRPMEQRQHRREVVEGIPGYGVSVSESVTRAEMDVHPSVELPEGADAGLSAYLPEYVGRDLDGDLRAWLRGHKATGGFVVLAGDSAAGKTRMLFEALRVELPAWQMLCPDGAQLHALAHADADLEPTVIWLDDIESCIGTGMLTAATLKRLISRPSQPVLLAATIRTEELAKAFMFPASATEPEINRHVREVLGKVGRWSRTGSRHGRTIRFDVPDRFSPDEIARAETVAGYDPRLGFALRDAEGGRITATLAGTDDLLAHWTDGGGDPAGQAIITAAVVARLCGRPEPIPAGVIERLALARLTAEELAPSTAAWSTAAFGWAERPLRGSIRAVRAVRTEVGRVDGYRVSDVLIQRWSDGDGQFVQWLLDAPATWSAMLSGADAPTARSVGLAAYGFDKTGAAENAWLRAAGAGDVEGMVYLASLYRRLDRPESRKWYEAAARRGNPRGMLGLGQHDIEAGDVEGGLALLRKGAELGGTTAMVQLGFWLMRRDPAESEHWLRRAAAQGDVLAMTNLGFMLGVRGDLVEAEQLHRRAAELGNVGAAENLAVMLRDRGEDEAAFDWFRRAAEAAYENVMAMPPSVRRWASESQDSGNSNAILGYADMLQERGSAAAAEQWYTRLADSGDARAAARLAVIAAARGDRERARRERGRAAELARENLRMHWSTLRAVYGPAGTDVHVLIIGQHADGLEEEGDGEQAAVWRQRATGPWTDGDRTDGVAQDRPAAT